MGGGKDGERGGGAGGYEAGVYLYVVVRWMGDELYASDVYTYIASPDSGQHVTYR